MRRFALVPFLLLAVPIVEIALFVLVGGEIGLGWTLGLVLFTAILGTVLLRVQGFAVMNRIRAESTAGRVPGRELVHAFLLLIAGILLLTPGFFTDAIGFALFVPPLRDAVWAGLKDKLIAVVPGGAAAASMGGSVGGMGHGRSPFGPGGPFQRGDVVDLDADEFEVSRPADRGRTDPD